MKPVKNKIKKLKKENQALKLALMNNCPHCIKENNGKSIYENT